MTNPGPAINPESLTAYLTTPAFRKGLILFKPALVIYDLDFFESP